LVARVIFLGILERVFMSSFRVLALPVLLLLALVACQKEGAPSGQGSGRSGGFPKVLSVNLDNIGELYDTTVASAECRSDSDTVVCTARNGKVDRWISWNIPESPDGDGDGTTFHRIGRWKGNQRFEVIQVGLAHDSPSFLFWDREGGGWIDVHPGTDSFYVAADLGSILILGWTPQSLQRWDYWRGLGGQAYHFTCTPPTGKIAVDTIARWIGPNLELVPLDFANLDANLALGCKEVRPLFDTAVPEYMAWPQPQLGKGANSTKG
jgi:hypothetical protein